VAQASRRDAHAKWTGINRLTKCRSVFVIAAPSLTHTASLAGIRTMQMREVQNNIHQFYECRPPDKNRQYMCVCVWMGNLSIAVHTHTRARVLILPAESAGGSCVCGLISCAKWICSLAPPTRIQSCSHAHGAPSSTFFLPAVVRMPHFSSRDPVWIFSLHIWIARKYSARLI
jgi:hypothetical protein